MFELLGVLYIIVTWHAIKNITDNHIKSHIKSKYTAMWQVSILFGSCCKVFILGLKILIDPVRFGSSVMLVSSREVPYTTSTVCEHPSEW